MLTEEEFLKEEKECADLIGITLKEYRNSLKTLKLFLEKIIKKENMIIQFYIN